ncbi:MAG: hypothetical protein FJX73_07650 [Armatimonadetes bacterium]|nr:hypothetical protein [Armatimonadota bacterium]
MSGNCETIVVDGQEVRTLRDLLPDPAGLKVLFVAKTPAPVSVQACHYFQGTQGTMFWNRLRKYRILVPTACFEDDSLLDHGFGITDIVKVPRGYGNEPSTAEYVAGMERILDLIGEHHPGVVVFVYKKVLDQVLRLKFGLRRKAVYGFNDDVRNYFGARVFAFPLPGTPCTREQAASAMGELAQAVGTRRGALPRDVEGP